jgi:hypothetical protein
LRLAVVQDLREGRSPATPKELADFETDVLAGFVHLVRRSQSEMPDQLRTVDLREPPKLNSLLLGEHITSRHPGTASAQLPSKPSARYASPESPRQGNPYS